MRGSNQFIFRVPSAGPIIHPATRVEAKQVRPFSDVTCLEMHPFTAAVRIGKDSVQKVLQKESGSW